MLKAGGYRAPSGWAAASLGENVTRLSTEARVEVLIEQLLDPVQHPCRITIHQPLRISRRTSEVLVRRIAAGRQAGDGLRGADQASRFDAAIYLPRDEQVVLVKKG